MQEVREILLQPRHLKEIMVETHCPQISVPLAEVVVVVVQARLVHRVMLVEMVALAHQMQYLEELQQLMLLVVAEVDLTSLAVLELLELAVMVLHLETLTLH
jgi:hypothetical protein